MSKHGCTFEDSVISELVKDLCELNPFTAALGVDGPLSTHYRRDQFIKEHLSLTEPVEYILDVGEKKTFQYTNSTIIFSTCEQQTHLRHNITEQQAI